MIAFDNLHWLHNLQYSAQRLTFYLFCTYLWYLTLGSTARIPFCNAEKRLLVGPDVRLSTLSLGKNLKKEGGETWKRKERGRSKIPGLNKLHRVIQCLNLAGFKPRLVFRLETGALTTEPQLLPDKRLTYPIL